MSLVLSEYIFFPDTSQNWVLTMYYYFSIFSEKNIAIQILHVYLV